MMLCRDSTQLIWLKVGLTKGINATEVLRWTESPMDPTVIVAIQFEHTVGEMQVLRGTPCCRWL
jgi:hypothetical protein